MRNDLGVDGLLDRLVFQRRLDDQIDARHGRFQGRERRDARKGRIRLGLIDQAAGGMARQAGGDLALGQRQALGDDVVQSDRIAAQRDGLGDACAHLSGAQDGDCGNRAHEPWSNVVGPAP